MDEIRTAIMFGTIIATFIIGLLNLYRSFSISKKGRYVEIASARRKERMDNFIIFYSKVSAFAHPDTIKAYAENNDFSIFEKLIENCNNISMLFDRRYQKDTEIVVSIKSLMKKTIRHYYCCRSSNSYEESTSEYEYEYYLNTKKIDKLISRVNPQLCWGTPNV